MGDDDKAGYKRPPKRTQFKPGQSGNLKGRPKQKKMDFWEVNNALVKQLRKKSRVILNGKATDVSNLDALILSTLNTAIKKGDAKTLKWILEVIEEARLNNPHLPSIFK